MKDRILSILFIIFSILMIFYPISYSLSNITYSISNLRIILFYILICVIMYFIIKWLNVKILKKYRFKISEKYYGLIVLILAILSRIGTIILFRNDIIQVSDFASALEKSYTLDFAGDYYRVFTHWIMYPRILNFIYKIFGTSQIVAYITNAIILVAVSLMVYKTASLLFKNKKDGLLAAIIYIFWPANILYTIIFTQEHLCSLLLIISIYLFLKVLNNNYNNITKYINFIIIGILLGISTFLKNFAIVFLIAFLIYLILLFFKEKVNIKSILIRFSYVIIIFITFTITKTLIFNYYDTLVKNNVARNIIPCYLNVGFRDDGTYSDINYQMYFDSLSNNNYDFNKTNKEILNNLKNYWKNEKNLTDLTKLLEYKANIIYGSDDAKLYWVDNTLTNKTLSKNIYNINNLYYILLNILMLLGLKDIVKNKNLNKFLLYLVFLGSMLLLLLVEAQGRYMYAVQPYMCIMAIMGIKEIKKTSKR